MNNQKKKQAVFFDLDGTLWDASEAIAKSWNTILIPNHLPTVTRDDLLHYMGLPMDEIARLAFDGKSEEEQQDLMDQCSLRENEYLEVHGGCLFPNLRPTLEALKEKYFLAVISNCQCGYIEAFIKAHHLEDLFDDTISWGQTIQDKNVNIQIMMHRNDIDQAVYIGDIKKDWISSCKAGIPFILAEYGFGDAPATHKIDSLEKAPEAIEAVFADYDNLVKDLPRQLEENL